MPSYNWENAKKNIITILKSNESPAEKQKKIESYLETLPLEPNIANYNISYCSCGYPSWATSTRRSSDSFKLRDLLNRRFNEEMESEYSCPYCDYKRAK